MEKDIGKIQKNDNTDIIVRIDDFGGKPGITIREFTTSERYTGFTKSGTRIPAESLKQFKEMVNSIDEKDLVVSEDTKKAVEEKAAAKEKKPARAKKPEKIEDVSEEDLL